MVSLLKIVIFHGYVSHNQMVNLTLHHGDSNQNRQSGDQE